MTVCYTPHVTVFVFSFFFFFKLEKNTRSSHNNEPGSQALEVSVLSLVHYSKVSRHIGRTRMSQICCRTQHVLEARAQHVKSKCKL